MTSLLGYSGDLAFRKGIYWCHRGGDLNPNVVELQKRLGGNFRLCTIDGFDELFGDLDQVLARQQRNLGAPPADAKPDYDDLPLENATLAELDLDLALLTARQYSKKLGLSEPTAATLKAFLRDSALSRTREPRNVQASVGRRLLPALIDACAIAGYRQMIAYIDIANEPSQHLHEAFGFERAGLLKGVGFKYGRWTDSILMQRALGPGGTIPPGDRDGAPIPQD
jgi:hypothetical protein